MNPRNSRPLFSRYFVEANAAIAGLGTTAPESSENVYQRTASPGPSISLQALGCSAVPTKTSGGARRRSARRRCATLLTQATKTFGASQHELSALPFTSRAPTGKSHRLGWTRTSLDAGGRCARWR